MRTMSMDVVSAPPCIAGRWMKDRRPLPSFDDKEEFRIGSKVLLVYVPSADSTLP
jgi:hypothetical protein